MEAPAGLAFAAPFVFAPPSGAAALTRARHARRPCARACAAAPQAEAALPAWFPAAGAARIGDPLAREMMASSRREAVQTPLADAPIATTYCETGAPDAQPLVCLHGFDSNMLEWRRLRPELADAPLRALYADVLGWGFGDKPPGLAYCPRDKREHLHAWKLRVVGDKPVALAGASIGGAIAIDYALAYPDHVSKLVLVDAQAFQDKRASPLLRRFPALAAGGAAVLKSRWLRKLAVSLSYHSDEFKTEDVLNIGGLHTDTLGWDFAATQFIIGDGYCVSERVSDIHVPTLVVYGAQDKILPSVENAARFQREIADCSVHEIPDCGHSPHVEKPKELAELIQQFLLHSSSTLEQVSELKVS